MRGNHLDRPGEVEREELRNAVVAIDGMHAQASRREIAAVVYGRDLVADQWSHPDGRLKAMMRRNSIRGARLVNGGWPALVARGCV